MRAPSAGVSESSIPNETPSGYHSHRTDRHLIMGVVKQAGDMRGWVSSLIIINFNRSTVAMVTVLVLAIACKVLMM